MENSVYLRAIEPEDLDRVYKWHNDFTLYQSLGGTYRFVSHKTVENWIQQKTTFSNNEINLAICIRQTNEHIGNIYLKDIDLQNRHGFLHILIGSPEHRTKGYGTQAVLKLMDHAFNAIGLERIVLHLLADNAAAYKLYQKCGFLQEGIMKRHVFKEGVFKDIIIMGICRDDYLKHPAAGNKE